MGVEGEHEPGSRHKVLKNLLGIRSKADMDRAERSALELAQNKYYTDGIVTPATRFTAELLRKMHLDWLGGTYIWAGGYRAVDMSKGGFVFPPAYLVAQNMRQFERDVLAVHTPLRPQALEDMCESLAVVHAEFLLIHPFREGNGRLGRWLADLMAAQAGLPMPIYGFTGAGATKNRENYLSAVFKGYGGGYGDLAGFFEACIRRALEGRARFDFSARGDAPSKTEDS